MGITFKHFTTAEISASLDEMTDEQLVAYWNILQTPILFKIDDYEERLYRHSAITDILLNQRGIPHEESRRTIYRPFTCTNCGYKTGTGGLRQCPVCEE